MRQGFHGLSQLLVGAASVGDVLVAPMGLVFQGGTKYLLDSVPVILIHEANRTNSPNYNVAVVAAHTSHSIAKPRVTTPG